MKKPLILLLAAVFSLLSVFIAGCSSQGVSSNASGEGPTCSENIAMLQAAVDKYRNDVGVFPGNLQQLISDKTENWKGPYVSEIPACPAGGVYKVTPDGRVTE